MVQMRTWLTVADNSGARQLTCILHYLWTRRIAHSNSLFGTTKVAYCFDRHTPPPLSSFAITQSW